jgi:hypothetical protein
MANDSSTMLPATLNIIVNPQNGYVNVDSHNGEVNYNPDFDFMGQDSFIYVVCDAYNICDTALVVLNLKMLLLLPKCLHQMMMVITTAISSPDLSDTPKMVFCL